MSPLFPVLQEYDAWILDLHKIVEEHESMDDEQIASAIAKSLDQRHLLLKILSMNHYYLEENSRIEMAKKIWKHEDLGNSCKIQTGYGY